MKTPLQLFEDFLSGSRVGRAGQVGRGDGQQTGHPQQGKGAGMVGNAHSDAVFGSDDVGQLGMAFHHQGERAGPKGIGQDAGQRRNAAGGHRQLPGFRQEQGNGFAAVALLDAVEALDALTVEGPGGQSVNRIGRESDHAAVVEHVHGMAQGNRMGDGDDFGLHEERPRSGERAGQRPEGKSRTDGGFTALQLYPRSGEEGCQGGSIPAGIVRRAPRPVDQRGASQFVEAALTGEIPGGLGSEGGSRVEQGQASRRGKDAQHLIQRQAGLREQKEEIAGGHQVKGGGGERQAQGVGHAQAGVQPRGAETCRVQVHPKSAAVAPLQNRGEQSGAAAHIQNAAPGGRVYPAGELLQRASPTGAGLQGKEVIRIAGGKGNAYGSPPPRYACNKGV